MQQIVLLEDDPLLRSTLAELLMLDGFDVHYAQTETEAFAACEQGEAAGCVLIADRALHTQHGETLDGHCIAEAALRRWPSLRVVYTSGSPEISDRLLSARERVLLKPFPISQLNRVLADLLA